MRRVHVQMWVRVSVWVRVCGYMCECGYVFECVCVGVCECGLMHRVFRVSGLKLMDNKLVSL